ncbi:hypothetical protein [Paraflavitalea speifideaquila]|uniref:hypothetical protein n=1 Tax=Paraflavitalea speifideaquila TaxID=3076558 RepID=UPI0028E420B8|nr:hypothetical protein [Paraflavitalea speifideiaquila]
MNYYAVKALQARVHLYRNDKVAALATAKSVVDNGGKWFPWIQAQRIVSDRTDPDRVFASELLFGLFNIDLYNTYKLMYAPELPEKYILAPNDSRLKTVFENNENDYRYNSMWILPSTGGKNYKTFLSTRIYRTRIVHSVTRCPWCGLVKCIISWQNVNQMPPRPGNILIRYVRTADW